MRPFTVALTGGIGSGKSTVAEMLRARGAGLIDTDAIAHELTQPGGAAMAAIGDQFGAQYVAADGSLERAAMRALAFRDADARKQLEQILHPRIRAEVARRLEASREPYVIVAIPLLFEGGRTQGYQRILVVDCDEQTQIARVMQRSQLTEQQVRAIMATQVARQTRLAKADDVIDNNRELQALETQVESLHQRYLQLSRQWREEGSAADL